MGPSQYIPVSAGDSQPGFHDEHIEAQHSSSSSASTAKLTPESDSEDDLDLEHDPGIKEYGELGKSFPLKKLLKAAEQGQKTAPQNEASRLHEAYDGDEEKQYKAERGRRASDSTVHSFMLYTPDEERAVVKKFDRKLVLFMALLYMLSFLDRSNIGNAKIAGLSRDLHLSSSQYEWLLTAFYITYILFEWMALLYRLIPPHIYISICVASWGVLASLQSVTTSFPFLVILRALLGVGEAAFGPGLPFYLSFFYKREELALRTGLFISAAPLSISFASSLAWVITKLGSHTPMAPWRLLFLIEGFPSVIVAVFVWMYVPDSPGTAVYLTRREKKVAKLRLRNEKQFEGSGDNKRGLKLKEILQTLADPKCYLTALMFFSCNVAFSSLPVFLPTIINDMGYSSVRSQALSAPPYLIAFFVVILTAFLSDRYRSRSTFVCFHALLGAAGYTLVALAGRFEWGTGWRYAGVYPATAGFFSAITIIITWTINNQDSDSKKGMGITLLNLIGQCGPLLGTRLYPDSDKPYYVKGMSICAGFMLFVFVLSLVLRFSLSRENRHRDIASLSVNDEDQEGLVGKGRAGREMEQFRFMI
ncbi:MAG: hypothetical protein M1827_002246 [Pycnora praestabilis]|nr:MAG: hypothetical protein M1827_002246 [Pycnora praestabilis]